MENILPNGRCFADVMTKMCCAVLTIPLDSPRSPFSNDDVIIIHYRTRVKVQRRSIGNHPSFF